MALLAELTEVEAEIAQIRLQLTEPKLGNPKYGMDRRVLTDKLEALQNREIGLYRDYFALLGHAGPGDWQVTVSHHSADIRRPDRTATARRVASLDAAGLDPHRFWFALHYELGRAVRGILELEGEPVPRDEHSDAMSLMQDDMHELLRLLELGDHARPISPHQVMQQEILPRVRDLTAYVNAGRKGRL